MDSIELDTPGGLVAARLDADPGYPNIDLSLNGELVAYLQYVIEEDNPACGKWQLLATLPGKDDPRVVLQFDPPERGT